MNRRARSRLADERADVERLESFTDVRRVQQHADEAGLAVADRAALPVHGHA